MVAPPSRLLTPSDLADVLGLTEGQVLELRRRKGWPCVRLGRSLIRFTPEQVTEIIARHTEVGRASAVEDSPMGQTPRSAARNRR